MPPQTTSAQHHEPTSTTTHRKIELQSPTELIYLHHLGSQAAHSKLTTAFPPSLTDPDDALRARVASLLDAFVTQTYADVRANVSANGVDLMSRGGSKEDEEVECMEAFDARLAERMREMEARKEVLTEKVADLRRTGGLKAAERWKGKWEGEMASFSAEEDVKMEEDVEVPELELGNLERWDALRETHAGALEGLVGLKVGMVGTVGKLAEAKRVGEELGGS
jgi:kinetochor protein Mis14/NSL1